MKKANIVLTLAAVYAATNVVLISAVAGPICMKSGPAGLVAEFKRENPEIFGEQEQVSHKAANVRSTSNSTQS
jgi:hypothetical protein